MQNIQELYPLSHLQSGLLFRTVYSGAIDEYLIQCVLELEGELDPTLFKQAWEATVLATDILRTGFNWSNPVKPIQFVLRSCDLIWNFQEEKTGDKQLLNRILLNDRKLGIDLTMPPLFRFHLIKHEKARYTLVWTYHHILLDGWSMPLIINYVFRYYEALVNKLSLPIYTYQPYKKFIAWHCKKVPQSEQEFWKNYLKGFTQPTYFNLNPKVKKHHVVDNKSLACEFSQLETFTLRQFARKHGITLSALFNAAWAILLNHYNKRDDVICGIVTSGRSISLDGVENIIGLLNNTSPVRVKFKELHNI